MPNLVSFFYGVLINDGDLQPQHLSSPTCSEPLDWLLQSPPRTPRLSKDHFMSLSAEFFVQTQVRYSCWSFCSYPYCLWPGDSINLSMSPLLIQSQSASHSSVPPPAAWTPNWLLKPYPPWSFCLKGSLNL